MRYTLKLLLGMLDLLTRGMGKHSEKYVKHPGRDFTRPRTLTIETVISLLLTMWDGFKTVKKRRLPQSLPTRGYVWGTCGNVLTESLFAYKLKQYPDGVRKYENFIRANWLGRRTADCVGLIKGYGWTPPAGRFATESTVCLTTGQIRCIDSPLRRVRCPPCRRSRAWWPGSPAKAVSGRV